MPSVRREKLSKQRDVLPEVLSFMREHIPSCPVPEIVRILRRFPGLTEMWPHLPRHSSPPHLAPDFMEGEMRTVSFGTGG